MLRMGQRNPTRSLPPESLFHSFFHTILYHPKKEQPATTRLYCSDCDKIFFEGVIRTRKEQLKFKIAVGTAEEHKYRGHEVVYVRPERLL